MTNLLLPTPPSRLLSPGRPIRASVTVGASPEVASHHLDQHPCPSTGHYQRGTYFCEADDGCAQIVECEVCGAALVAIVVQACEHLPELLDGLGVGT